MSIAGILEIVKQVDVAVVSAVKLDNTAHLWEIHSAEPNYSRSSVVANIFSAVGHPAN